MGHGKPGKSWNLYFQFPGLESHGISTVIIIMLSENKKAKRQKIKRNNRQVRNRL